VEKKVPEGFNFNHCRNWIKLNPSGTNGTSEWHFLNSYLPAIDPPTRVTSCGKRRKYVRVGSTAASLPPTFPPEATRIGLSKWHSCPRDLTAFKGL
jgi:hypothetical protein